MVGVFSQWETEYPKDFQKNTSYTFICILLSTISISTPQHFIMLQAYSSIVWVNFQSGHSTQNNPQWESEIRFLDICADLLTIC